MVEKRQLPLPFFCRSVFWLLLMTMELFKWLTGWWYTEDASFNLYLALYVILRRIEWEVDKQVPWFTSNN